MFRIIRLHIVNGDNALHRLACDPGSGVRWLQAKCGCDLKGKGGRGPPQVVPPRTALDNTAASAARKTALAPGGLFPHLMHLQRHLPEAVQVPVHSAGLIAICILLCPEADWQQVLPMKGLLGIMPKAAGTHLT